MLNGADQGHQWILIERPVAIPEMQMDEGQVPEAAAVAASPVPSALTQTEKLRCRLHVLSYSWLTLMEHRFRL